MQAPIRSAIAWRAMAREKVLRIALTIPGVVEALTHPSNPQTTASPGRAVWKLLRIIKHNGVSTRKPTTTSKIAIGNADICNDRIGKSDLRSNAAGWSSAWDLSLIIELA